MNEVKALHTISPKATLLQGESFKTFYQAITGYTQSNNANFLNIC